MGVVKILHCMGCGVEVAAEDDALAFSDSNELFIDWWKRDHIEHNHQTVNADGERVNVPVIEVRDA